MTDIASASSRVRPFFLRLLRRALIVLALYVVWSAWNYVEARRLDRAMQALHEREVALGFQSPPSAPPQYAEDAARLYEAAAALAFHPAGQSSLWTNVLLAGPARTLSTEDAAAAQAVLLQNAPAYELVSRAATVPMREWDSDYRERSRLQLNNLFSRLSFRVCALARTGQLDAAAAALADQVAMLRMFDRLARVPTSAAGSTVTNGSLIGQLVPPLTLLLDLGQPSAVLLERLQRTFAIDMSHDFDRVLVWEIRLLSEIVSAEPPGLARYTARGMSIPAFTPPLIETLLLPAIRREQARTAELVAEVIDAGKGSAPERLERLQAISKTIYGASGNPAFSIVGPWRITPALVDLSLNSARNIANADVRARCAVVALAIERYRLSTGRPPGALFDLVPAYLDAVPVDPFSDSPLRFVNDTTGYSVYSVGMNGKDDGGDLEAKWNERAVRMDPPPDVGLRITR